MENDQIHSARAIVSYPPVEGRKWQLENVTVKEIRDDELLVQMVATGVCHTDLAIGSVPQIAGPVPRVLGHEGAGYVKKVGSKVRVAKEGDAVLMSYASCTSCQRCRDGQPSYCALFTEVNTGAKPDAFRSTSNTDVGGSFFGQSSFSSLSAVREDSVVNVSDIIKSEEELKLFAPLGCGFQTGAGTVTDLAGTSEKDTVTIFGLGGVGLAAVMGAKVKGAKTIIGVDRIASRVELAKSLGATHVLNTSDPDLDLVQEIKKITQGAGTTVTVDASGNVGLITKGLEATAKGGQMILVGLMPMDAELNVHLVTHLQTSKSLRGSVEGGVAHSKYVPQMIEWYRESKFPIDKLIKYYPIEDFETAVADMHSGATVKPVLIY
ncbi:related to zinc-containing long-chain alcohol dehydrogenase [Lasallia pustulata]|nr:related to zinc-containing long-chain alcohol dehydrogenase [Lasallia pustulata]